MGTVSNTVWQHVAVTYDKASGLAALYANGSAVTTTNLGSFTRWHRLAVAHRISPTERLTPVECPARRHLLEHSTSQARWTKSQPIDGRSVQRRSRPLPDRGPANVSNCPRRSGVSRKVPLSSRAESALFARECGRKPAAPIPVASQRDRQLPGPWTRSWH